MTDKEKYEALVAEIKRLKDETAIGLNERENGVENGRMEVIFALEEKVNSMNEEQSPCVGCEGDNLPGTCATISSLGRCPLELRKHQKDGNLAPMEEPVSEDLDVIAREYAGIPCDAPKDLTYCVHDKKAKYDAVLFGAQWQKQKKIMEVWHDGKEEPKDKSKVILFQVGDKSQNVMTMEYHKEDKKFHIISPLGYGYVVGLWAYPEDILPDKYAMKK